MMFFIFCMKKELVIEMKIERVNRLALVMLVLMFFSISANVNNGYLTRLVFN